MHAEGQRSLQPHDKEHLILPFVIHYFKPHIDTQKVSKSLWKGHMSVLLCAIKAAFANTLQLSWQ